MNGPQPPGKTRALLQALVSAALKAPTKKFVFLAPNVHTIRPTLDHLRSLIPEDARGMSDARGVTLVNKARIEVRSANTISLDFFRGELFEDVIFDHACLSYDYARLQPVLRRFTS